MKPIMKFHPSLKKIFKEMDAWLAYEDNAASIEQDTTKINDYLNNLDVLKKGAFVRFDSIGHFYVNQASKIKKERHPPNALVGPQ